MQHENFGSTRALFHLLDVLPPGPKNSALTVLEQKLDRVRRQLVHRLADEMNRLAAASCDEVAAIAGVSAGRFFTFTHPDCRDVICRGSRMEILRLDRVVGGERACLCRVFRPSRLSAIALRPFRVVALSGLVEGIHGPVESGQAVLVCPGEPVAVSPGATFLVPHPVATSLICDAIQAGFTLRPPGRGATRLRLVSNRSRSGRTENR